MALAPLKRAVNTLGNRFLDKRTMASKALVQWRDDLIRDLGGVSALSRTQSSR